MEFIVPVSAEERARGLLDPGTTTAAATAMINHGFVALRGAFPVEAIDAMYARFTADYGGCDLAAMQALAAKPSAVTMVGDRRFEVVTRLNGAFHAGIFANSLLLYFLQPLLNEMVLSSVTTVVSYPGGDAQGMHRDHAHLYAEDGACTGLPPHAINVAVPLMDVKLETGPTAIWPGTHRVHDGAAASVGGKRLTFPFKRGDAVLIDYRTSHAGMPNNSPLPRPILYMVYARPWFVDDCNHQQRPPLNMSLADYQALPENVKPLLRRAYSQAMRAQFLEQLPPA